MPTIKSFAVGNGDMFYINHSSDNFTLIDCDLCEDNADDILAELKEKSRGKGIVRFISTHPDEDHFGGDRKSTRLNSSHIQKSRMPSSA